MDALKIFILGFLSLYIIQILDIIMNLLNSYSAIIITKCQAKINELSADSVSEDVHQIGFVYEPEEEYYEDDFE